MSCPAAPAYRDRFWLCLAALAALTATIGCSGVGDGQGPDPVVCTAEAVLATNPATGKCEWVSTCDHSDWEVCANGFTCEELPAEACSLDARCQLESRSVCADCAGEYPGDPRCGCVEDATCAPRQVDTGCATLAEAACMATPGCTPQYGWTDGSAGDPDAGDPAPGAPMPAPCQWDDCFAPEPPTSTWAFLGCQDNQPTRCAELDERACLSTAGCAPLYLATPCFCEDQTLDCVCPDVFAGCENVTTPPPPTCFELYDVAVCNAAPGCLWTDLGGTEPCFCDADDCYCDVPVGGACVPDPQSRVCEGLFDEASCWTSPSCEWFGSQGTCQCDASGQCWCDEQPGHCATRTQTSCWDLYDAGACGAFPGCEWIGEGGSDCFCDPSYPGCDCKVMPGYCQPAQQPSCWDLTDEWGCSSRPDCHWNYAGSFPDPYPCDCRPDDPSCGCDMPAPAPAFCEPRPEPTCRDLYDEWSCSTRPDCQWSYGGPSPEPYPCDCLPEDPNCGCGMPAPAYGYCEPRPQGSCSNFGDDVSCAAIPGCAWFEVYGEVPCVCDDAGNCDCGPDACWGAWIDASGQCRAPNDGGLPLECCYGTGTYGYCDGVPRPDTCDSLWDPQTCEASGCTWLWESCDCLPDDPSCGCRPGGFCVGGI